MSPSMGSCTSITLESEDDDLGGLVLPDETLDFAARLEQRKQRELEESKFDPPVTVPAKRIRPGQDDDDDLLSGLRLALLGRDDVFLSPIDLAYGKRNSRVPYLLVRSPEERKLSDACRVK